MATRCNIDCSYCYWFRDAAVYNKPKLMSTDVLHQLLQRIEQHLARYSLVDFPIILHGGEPLLWGVENFHRFAEACEDISSRTGCEIPVAVTTNGLLIDGEWLDCFEARNISVAISLDGPAHIHDLHRRTFQGTGTHAAVERAARMLVSRDTAGLQKLRNSSEYRLCQLVALQEMPEVQDGRFVGNCVASELQTCERAHRADVVNTSSAPGSERLYHCCRQ